MRLFLAFLSVAADAVLVVALSRKYGKRLASYALAMLCLTSGCFFASTSESLSINFIFVQNIFNFLIMIPTDVSGRNSIIYLYNGEFLFS